MGKLNDWINEQLGKYTGASKAQDAIRSGIERAAEPKVLEQQLLESLQASSTYKSPEEALQFQQLMEQAGAGLTETGAKIEESALARTGMSEAPGAAIQRENIRQMMTSASRDIIESGGASASALGAISQTRAQEMGALRDLAIQGQQYKDQAQRDYLQALRESAGLGAQAAQLQGAGLQMMIGEKGKEYESELDKLRTEQQFRMTQIGNTYAELEGARNREAQRKASNKQLVGDIIGGILG